MWELNNKKGWALKNWCLRTVVLEKTWESLGLQGDQPVNPKGNQPWIFIERTDAEAEATILWSPDNEELTHWKRPWSWETLQTRGEGDDRGWDGWMASPTLWTWVWASSRRWWRTGKPDLLRSTGLQRVRHDWVTEQQQHLNMGGSYADDSITQYLTWNVKAGFTAYWSKGSHPGQAVLWVEQTTDFVQGFGEACIKETGWLFLNQNIVSW